LTFVASPSTKPEKKIPNLPPELLKLVSGQQHDGIEPPYEQSKLVLTDNKVSFLARQILAREEWKRLAYALGFYPDDVRNLPHFILLYSIGVRVSLKLSWCHS